MAWAWGPLADKTVGALMNPPMKALQNYLGLAEKTYPRQDILRTTDETVTTLHTETVPVNIGVCVSGYVVARRTGGASGAANDGAAYRVEFLAKNTAGTAALIGSGTVTVLGESQAGWDCTLAASGGTILVQVTGAAGNNVTWNWSGRTLAGKE